MKTLALILSFLISVGVYATDWDKQLWDGVVEKNPSKVQEALDNGADIHQKVGGYNILMQLPVNDFRKRANGDPNTRVRKAKEPCDPTHLDFKGQTNEEIREYLDQAIQNRLRIIQMLVNKDKNLLFEIVRTGSVLKREESLTALKLIIYSSVMICSLPNRVEPKTTKGVMQEYFNKKYSHGSSASLSTQKYLEYLFSIQEVRESNLHDILEEYLIFEYDGGNAGFIEDRSSARGVARWVYWNEVSENIFNAILSVCPELHPSIDSIKDISKIRVESARKEILESEKRFGAKSLREETLGEK